MNYSPLYQTPKPSFWKSKTGRIILWAAAILLALELLGRFSGGESSSYLQSGGEAYLSIPGNSYVNVASSESACKEMEDAFSALDEEKLKALLLHGLIYPADNNSVVIVLDKGINRAKVKITSGNQAGEVGWVPIGYLRRR